MILIIRHFSHFKDCNYGKYVLSSTDGSGLKKSLYKKYASK